MVDIENSLEKLIRLPHRVMPVLLFGVDGGTCKCQGSYQCSWTLTKVGMFALLCRLGMHDSN